MSSASWAPTASSRRRSPTRCRSSEDGDSVCSYGFDLGPKQLDAIRSGALDGALGQQPFLQGFWPVAQLYLQIDRGVSAADLDTKAQLVTKANVDTRRQAVRELEPVAAAKR